MSNFRTGVVSVVVVNFKGVDDTVEAVNRLADVDWPADKLEVVVVENGSGDDSEQRLAAAFSGRENVTLVVSPENLGFTGGSNLGAARSNGEFVAFLNNDAKPDAAWIRAAMAQFDLGPEVAAVGSKVLSWDGVTVDFAGGSLTWFGMGYKDHVGEPDSDEYNVAKDILFGTGSALFVRASVFAQIGGFDEKLFMFYDDVDLGWRLNLLGYRVRFAPASIVYHKHHGSMSSFGPYRESYLLERNALYLVYKNLSDELLGKYLPGALALTARRAVAKGGLDSTAFDLRRFDGSPDEAEAEVPIPKETVAGLYALDQFVQDLPELSVARADLQQRRVRTDAELFRLFGDMNRPLQPSGYFLSGLADIVASLGIDPATRKTHVLIVTGDSIGDKMAGPAMRAWKIAELLSRTNDVRLVSWNSVTRSSPDFELAHVRLHNEREIRVHEKWADVIVFQGHALHHFETLRDSTKIIVADIYDPMHLETLEQGSDYGTELWRSMVSGANEVLNQQLERGDFFLCASERQRMFWLGQLAGLGRVNPDTYRADKNLSSLIAVAPFGLDSTPPRHERKAIRGVVPGIDEDDKLVIWGGGIYNWFDTLTLVRAVAQLAERRPNVRLFFMGVKHPNPDVPEMALVGRTRELAQRLGVADKNVFFNDSWVSIDDRQNYLLEADAGVSTHYEHIETTFSFRTRILDYLWAGLPIVTTAGDSFGDLTEARGLGISVPEQDVDALADALEKALYDEEFALQARGAVASVREEFTWERALKPLVDFCRDPRPAPDRAVEYVAGFKSAVAGVPRRRVKPTSREHAAALELDEIVKTKTGVSKDVALLRHYLSEGGVGLLTKRAIGRISGLGSR